MEFRRLFDRADRLLVGWMAHTGVRTLRFALAVVFIWFGALKIVGASPAAALVARTVYWADPSWFLPLLGWWEVLIGVCFLHRSLIRFGIALLAPQMVGTFLPLFLLPDATFQAGRVLIPTLEGQYIIKNLVIIAAAIMVGATLRGDAHTQKKVSC